MTKIIKPMYHISLALFIYATSQKLQFAFINHQDGHFLEYQKNKMLREAYGEDAFATTPYSLAVSDGVGGCQFSSKYISNTLVTSAAQFYSDMALTDSQKISKSQFREKLLEKLTEDLYGLNLFVSFEYLRASLLYSVDPAFRNQLFNLLPTSATLVSGFIEEDKASGKHKLRIFQKGDSLIAVFRKTPSIYKDYYSYTLYAVTPEHQAKFNTPYQFSSTHQFTNFFQDNAYEIDIRSDDIVVAGSDGLFDNVFVGYLTYMINAIIYEQIYLRPEADTAAAAKMPVFEVQKQIKDFDLLGRLTKKYFAKLAEKHHDITITKAKLFGKYKKRLQKAEAARVKQENEQLTRNQSQRHQRIDSHKIGSGSIQDQALEHFAKVSERFAPFNFYGMPGEASLARDTISKLPTLRKTSKKLPCVDG